jgi:tetratricopeptide (TPR) repeat protein
MYSLNDVALLEGDLEKATRGHEEVLDIRRNVIGQMHRDVAKSLNALGICLLEKGQYLEARSMLERSLSMRKKLLGNEHPDVGESLHYLGLICIAQGKCEDALVLLERALTNRRLALGSRHPLVAETLCSIAAVHNTQRNIIAAYDYLADSLKIRRVAFGNDSLVTAETLFGIATNLHISGVYVSRTEYLKKMEAEFTEEEPSTKQAEKVKFPLDKSINLLSSICSGAQIDLSDVQNITLESLFEVSNEKSLTSADKEHLETESIEKSNFVSARYLYNLVMETRVKWLASEHPLLIETMHAVNVNNLQAGKIMESREQSELVLFLRRKVLGEKHPR